jgi:hypothetical protein
MEVVSFAPRQLYRYRKKAGTNWMGGWLGSRADLDSDEGKNPALLY